MIDPSEIFEYVQMSEFTIEDVPEDIHIRSLSSKIKKRFTSNASTYAIIFKWDFGDDTTEITHKRSIIHEYQNPGTYIVKHQACFLDTECCYINELPWCIKSIIVEEPIPLNLAPLLMFGSLFGFMLIVSKKRCEDHTTKKECEDADCLWINGKCVEKKKKRV